MKTLIASGIAAASLVSAASADVTYTFTNQVWTGFNFNEAYAAGTLTGTLTGATVNATLNASTAYTYADDLCIYVAGSPLAFGGLLQCGGFSDLQTAPTNRYAWGVGGSSTPGTTMNTTVNFTTGVNMSANPTMSVWIGNGYGAAGTSGTFTGTITLLGVTAVPAPGAVALLGLAGFCSRRRRA
jgi:MYXO-CTERM domain-containing protein